MCTKSLEHLLTAVPYTVAFHELAEAYAKVDKGMQHEQAHADAIKREDTLRAQRSELTKHDPGSGGPTGHPVQEIIIKR